MLNSQRGQLRVKSSFGREPGEEDFFHEPTSGKRHLQGVTKGCRLDSGGGWEKREGPAAFSGRHISNEVSFITGLDLGWF